MNDKRKTMLIRAAVALLALVVLGASVGAGYRLLAPAAPLLPPASSEQVVTKPAPNVVLSIRDLKRLESAEMHMERVMDVRSKQSRFFGLVQSEDALLLVAAGDVTAGVDLAELTEADVEIDWNARRAKISLPPPKVLGSKIDNEHTYVYSRKVDVLATRKETLESEARAEAEKELIKGAEAAGILDRAGRSAAHTVEGLVRALGFEHVEVTVKPAR